TSLLLSRSPWARRKAVRAGITGWENGTLLQPVGFQAVGAGTGRTRGGTSSAGAAWATALSARTMRAAVASMPCGLAHDAPNACRCGLRGRIRGLAGRTRGLTSARAVGACPPPYEPIA